MKVGIVGSSSADTPEQYARVLDYVKSLKQQHGDNLTIISGGAEGIDSFAKKAAIELGIPDDRIIIFPPKQEGWDGYKQRNIQIAMEADMVVSFALPSKNKEDKCYHCLKFNRDGDHEKTAGCWTANKAMILRKQIKIIVLS